MRNAVKKYVMAISTQRAVSALSEGFVLSFHNGFVFTITAANVMDMIVIAKHIVVFKSSPALILLPFLSK